MSKVEQASLDQQLLLEKINQYTAANRRTDKLAQCMQQFGKRWDTSHTAFIGLQLRALGWATTFKDNSQYAEWNITPLGKAALCELRNVKQEVKLPPVSTYKILGYRVIGESDGELSSLLKSEKEANELAEKWAREEPGCPYEVAQVIGKVVAEVSVKKVTA